PGRLILTANPSALTGYDEAKPDLLNKVNGNYQYMKDNAGLIEATEYGTVTTAGEGYRGDVAGYVRATKFQRGELGIPELRQQTSYFARTAGGSTVYVVAGTADQVQTILYG